MTPGDTLTALLGLPDDTPCELVVGRGPYRLGDIKARAHAGPVMLTTVQAAARYGWTPGYWRDVAKVPHLPAHVCPAVSGGEAGSPTAASEPRPCVRDDDRAGLQPHGPRQGCGAGAGGDTRILTFRGAVPHSSAMPPSSLSSNIPNTCPLSGGRARSVPLGDPGGGNTGRAVFSGPYRHHIRHHNAGSPTAATDGNLIPVGISPPRTPPKATTDATRSPWATPHGSVQVALDVAPLSVVRVSAEGRA